MLSSDFGLNQLPADNDSFIEENELTRYIADLDTPRNQKQSLEQFKGLYEKVSLEDWCNTELVFDLGNYIMQKRPDLISLGIRLNVQVNLFLRTIKNSKMSFKSSKKSSIFKKFELNLFYDFDDSPCKLIS